VRRKIIAEVAASTHNMGRSFDRVYSFRADGHYVPPETPFELVGLEKPALMKIPVRGLTREEGQKLGWLISASIPEQKQTKDGQWVGTGPPMHTGPINIFDFIPPELQDELDAWFTDDRQRTWRVGTAFPACIPPQNDWPRLSAGVCLQIRRAHSPVHDSSSEKHPTAPSIGHLYDPTTGGRVGTLFSEGLAPRERLYVCINDRVHPDDADLEAICIDPIDAHVTPWPCPVRHQVTA
jgi:hypothetical protein